MRVYLCVCARLGWYKVRGPGVQTMFLLFLREETIAMGLFGAIGQLTAATFLIPLLQGNGLGY